MKKNRVNKFNVGGSHRRSPLGGIPINGDLVEQGETSVDFGSDKYIFSKKLFVDDTVMDLPMKFPRGLNYAEATEYVKDKLNTGNKIDKDTEMEVLTALRVAQEQDRESKGLTGPADEKGWGGTIGTILGGVVGAVIGGGWNFGAGALPGAGIGASIGGAVGGSVDIIETSRKNKKKEDERRNKEQEMKGRQDQLIAAKNKTPEESRSRIFEYGGASTPITDVTLGDPVIVPDAPIDVPTESGLYYTENMLDNDDTYLNTVDSPDFQYDINQSVASDYRTPLLTEKANEVAGITNETTSGEADPNLNFYQKLKENLGAEGVAGLAMKTGLGLGYNALRLGTLKRPEKAPRYGLGERREANLMHLGETRRALSRQRQSMTHEVANKSDGNVNQFMQYQAALHGKSGEALGRTFIEQQQINNKEQLSTDQFNLRQSQLDARNNMFADELDAKNEAAYDNQVNAYSDAIAKNLISGSQTIQNIGQGNVMLTEAERNALMRYMDENPETTS